MISTIKLSGPNVTSLGDRIKKEGFGCLDRIDSMQLCRMLLSISSNNYGESSIHDIANGILNSCGDQSNALGMHLINKFRLGVVWKFTTDYGLNIILSKLPRPDGHNVSRITLEYEVLAKELDGSEYEAVVSRPLIEYSSQRITVFKVDQKENFVKGLKNESLFHEPPEVVEVHHEPEEEQPSTEPTETKEENNESIPDDDGEGTEAPAPEGSSESLGGEPDGHDPSGDSEDDGAGLPEGSGSDDGLTSQEESPTEEEEPCPQESAEEQEPRKKESEVNIGNNVVSFEVLPEYVDSQLDTSPYAQESKLELYDKIMDVIGHPDGLPEGADSTEVTSRTEAVLDKLIASPLATGKLLDRDYEIGGVKYDFRGGYTVEIRIKEPERELQNTMQSDKEDQPVKTDFVDITDPEYRNGTLMAMFGTTAPSANHVHTFLNDYHNQAKTKSFLETKIDGQGTYPTESDVFYDDVVWAFVKMKDGKFWRIAIARRDYGLEDESWIATHHIPGRWVTLAEVQDGPSFHGGYRRRNW